jgi:CRISPR-associated protein Cas6
MVTDPLDTDAPPAEVVEVAFAVRGTGLPRDWRAALAQGFAAAAPELAADARTAVRLAHAVPGGGGPADPTLLSPRTRLVVRAPREQTAAVARLSGLVLHMGGFEVHLGAAKARELLAHGTLYAHFVATDAADEAAFLQVMAAELQALDARCLRVCGRLQQVRSGDGMLRGYSLMLHGLSAAASLRVQERGLGSHRLMGCGVFVPHKSAAAVGE